MLRIVVLDGHTVNPGDTSWSPLEGFGELVIHPHTERAAIADRARGAHVLVTNKAPIDARVLSTPGLLGVCVTATGVNVVDIDAATARKIPVCNVPSYGTGSVVEHTFALLLELCRAAGLHDRAVHDGAWTSNRDFSFWRTPQLTLGGKRLGVIGHGNIGSAVARVALAFGMNVVATQSRSVPVAPDVEIADVDAIFRSVDVLTLHCPLTPLTRELVCWERLKLMKPSALLVNTARGGLVREQDLARALEEGVIAGAGLDVLTEEPPRADNPLLRAPRCIVTPHLAWATLEARTRLIEVTASNVRGIVSGEPIHVVNAVRTAAP